jgi:hypothetical protein
MFVRGAIACSLVVAAAACGGAAVDTSGASGTSSVMPTATASTAATASTPAAPQIPPAHPDIELMSASSAVAFGKHIEFDGIEEALVWPRLAKLLPEGDARPLVVQLERDVPIQSLLRAVFTLRVHDIKLQSRDDGGVMRVVELKPKPDATLQPGLACHLAVFLKPDGALRVAAPGGKRDIPSPNAPQKLAQALLAELPLCPIKYIAFGAETNDVPFGPVFDVMLAVDDVKAAGDARYVLGEAIHPQ